MCIRDRLLTDLKENDIKHYFEYWEICIQGGVGRGREYIEDNKQIVSF